MKYHLFRGIGPLAILVTLLRTLVITPFNIASYHVTALSHIEVNTNSIVTMMIHDVTMIINDMTRIINDMTRMIVAVMSGAVPGIQSYAYLRACR